MTNHHLSLEEMSVQPFIVILKETTKLAYPTETFASIAQWANETFGECTPGRILDRAEEEYQELLKEEQRYIVDGDGTLDNLIEEAADVIICLARLPGISDVINAKMSVNRARKWELRGDGTGYHVQ